MRDPRIVTLLSYLVRESGGRPSPKLLREISADIIRGWLVIPGERPPTVLGVCGALHDAADEVPGARPLIDEMLPYLVAGAWEAGLLIESERKIGEGCSSLIGGRKRIPRP
jgi:hypothetical protein